MQVNEKIEQSYKPWTEEEDKLLIGYRLKNKTPTEIGVLLNRSEFVINLRIHLLIHRLHRSGHNVAEIRLMMNEELSHILDVITPTPPRTPICRQENVWWNNLVQLWERMRYSF